MMLSGFSYGFSTHACVTHSFSGDDEYMCWLQMTLIFTFNYWAASGIGVLVSIILEANDHSISDGDGDGDDDDST